MRKTIGILVCLLLIATSLLAVSYQPCRINVSAAQGGYQAASVLPSSDFRSTSAYDNRQPLAVSHHSASLSGSMQIISASNFDALNSEDGMFSETSASASSIRRGGRPGGGGGSGGGAIGEYDFHSPVGNLPWMVFVLFAVAYVSWKRRKSAHPQG